MQSNAKEKVSIESKQEFFSSQLLRSDVSRVFVMSTEEQADRPTASGGGGGGGAAPTVAAPTVAAPTVAAVHLDQKTLETIIAWSGR